MSTLAELVSEHGYKGAKIATAVNGEFVAAPRRATVILQENDSVEIVSARQGG